MNLSDSSCGWFKLLGLCVCPSGCLPSYSPSRCIYRELAFWKAGYGNRSSSSSVTPQWGQSLLPARSVSADGLSCACHTAPVGLMRWQWPLTTPGITATAQHWAGAAGAARPARCVWILLFGSFQQLLFCPLQNLLKLGCIVSITSGFQKSVSYF